MSRTAGREAPRSDRRHDLGGSAFAAEPQAPRRREDIHAFWQVRRLETEATPAE